MPSETEREPTTPRVPATLIGFAGSLAVYLITDKIFNMPGDSATIPASIPFCIGMSIDIFRDDI